MKATTMCAVLLMSGAMCKTASGGESRSPEQLGAHWARVSDEAQIQLIVDGLRATGGGDDLPAGMHGGIVRKRVPSFLKFNQQSLRGTSGGTNRAMLSEGLLAEKSTEQAAVRWRINMKGDAASVDFLSGERLQLRKTLGEWKVTGGSVPSTFRARVTTPALPNSMTGGSGVTAGETFIAAPVSHEHSIDRLTKSVAQSKIDRQLFSIPEKTASYYSVRYMRTPPFVVATYVQLIIDPEWNRIVYGNMNKWIKRYDVRGPSAIAVDADGNVFVGEPANKRVVVLRLVGNGDDVELQHRHQISDIVNPTDIALNDNGTPINTSDDHVYIADASRNKIFKYTAGANTNSLVATFEGFDSPIALAVGRWNGANENILYVVDKIAKRIRVFDDEGSSLALLGEFNGDYSQYFKTIKTDHFGNVYVVDNVNSKILKLTASLDFLDEEGGDGTFAALGTIDLPFGKITVDGEGTWWTGFDQLFAIERWDDGSGAQRRKLGVKMRNIDFRADADISAVSNSFVLTDVSNVSVRIYDENKRLVRTLTSSWMLAGQKDLLWDRRSDEGTQVPAGTYRYEIGAASAYSGEPTISNTRFYLPLYYHEDCGSANRVNDAHLVQGSVVAWGDSPSQTASEHASSVQYRFTGLKPAGEYEVAAEFAAGDGVQRLQELTANGVRLCEPVRLTGKPTVTAFLKLPKDSYVNGDVTIAVNRLGEGSAIVTQLWLKETGVGFHPQPIATIPTKYLLEQNYPNPFNPTTTIRYAIPNDGFVTLKVYSITGQEVATLVNEPRTAGKYETTFDAKNTLGTSLASGIYFYRVSVKAPSGKVGSYTETKKMILLR